MQLYTVIDVSNANTSSLTITTTNSLLRQLSCCVCSYKQEIKMCFVNDSVQEILLKRPCADDTAPYDCDHLIWEKYNLKLLFIEHLCEEMMDECKCKYQYSELRTDIMQILIKSVK